MVKVTHTGVTDPKTIEETLRKEGFFNIFSWSDPAGASYPPHTHPHYEVRWIVDGELVIEQDGKKYHLKPGDRMESEPDVLHSAYAPTNVTYICGSR
jgi:quercetin dioxygenase-like cupin family protein